MEKNIVLINEKIYIKGLIIKLIWIRKSSLTPLSQRGVLVPPFGKGRLGGISQICRYNYETVNNKRS